MARRRFFVDQVRKGQPKSAAKSAHHLTRVLRVEVGQKFEITDSSRVWLASVESARKDLVGSAVLEELAPGPQLSPVTPLSGADQIRPLRMGGGESHRTRSRALVPVEAARSERGSFRRRAETCGTLATHCPRASEQSRRLRPPRSLRLFAFPRSSVTPKTPLPLTVYGLTRSRARSL